MTALTQPGAASSLWRPAASNSRCGRCIALFPGAFKPPHNAHLYAVHKLLARSQVDEVVVIISARSRRLPGTAQTIDAELARQIWSIYLDGVPNVRVEIAVHTAVQHALGCFQQASAGDTLWFCLGEADYRAGDARFKALPALAAASGVTAEIIAAPTAALPTRATALRAALAQGGAGYESFLAALPGHLSRAQRERVWALCRCGVKASAAVFEQRLRALLARRRPDWGVVRGLSVVKSEKPDPVYRAHFSDGRSVYVKYAGDTIVADDHRAKPRRRLATERRALQYLRTRPLGGLVLPEVLLFDKATRTLILSDVCSTAGTAARSTSTSTFTFTFTFTSLQCELSRGRFDAAVAAAAGRFLGVCHTPADRVRAMWGDADSDERQWQRTLARFTLGQAAIRSGGRLGDNLTWLQSVSAAAATRYRGRGFFHLDLCPKNLLIGPDRIGVIDFEASAHVGDPALELGTLLSHYLYWRQASTGTACGAAIAALLAAYRQTSAQRWPLLASRVVAFAGAGLLACSDGDAAAGRDVSPDHRNAVAASLLAQGRQQVVDVEAALCRAWLC